MNKISLTGNIASELKTIGATGVAFNVLDKHYYERKNKDSGKYEPIAEVAYFRVIAFGDTANAILTLNLQKGKQVTIEGRIRDSKFEKNGVTTYSKQIVAESVILG